MTNSIDKLRRALTNLDSFQQGNDEDPRNEDPVTDERITLATLRAIVSEGTDHG